jgi:hypothetical protein
MQDRFSRSPKLIELQLLRHGEALNQLLSPLTEYFALCGDHDSGTINVSMKHRSLLTKLRALDYEDSAKTQDDQLDEMTELVTGVLSRVPGLGTELSGCYQQLAHVSLATNAAELSMVPFELARMPSGTAGAGQPMCLQPHVPVCLTRRSRNVNRPALNWERNVRILMIASDAGGDIPLQAHYANLRKLVDPWLAVPRGQEGDSQEKVREKCLKLLKNPTVSEIRECLRECKPEESFTHIHILAHGAACDRDANRFGVVLPSSKNSAGPAVIDGEQLAAVLGYDPERSTSSPLVVTLAICQSSRQGGVIMPGSSLAFELHSKGVPLVVGSQFPLTFGGSITMARELYAGFLLGHDPRAVIWNTRRALFEETQHALPPSIDQRSPHDWASLTVYAQLPKELDEWLPQMERDQIYGRLKTKMDHLDYLSGLLDENGTATVEQDSSKNAADFHPDDLQKPLEQVEQFEQWIDGFKWKTPADEAVSRGILASAMKRLGIVFLRLSSSKSECKEARDRLWKLKSGFQNHPYFQATNPEVFRTRLEKLGRKALTDAEQQYSRIFDLDRDQGWALVQSLSLNLALHGSVLYDDFQTAMVINLRDRGRSCARRRCWAMAALAELSLMRSAIQKLELDPKDKRWQVVDELCSQAELEKKFSHYVENLILLAREVPNDVRSSLLQFQRLEHDLIPMAFQHSGHNRIPEISSALAASSEPEGKTRSAKKSATKVAASEAIEKIKTTHFNPFVQGMIAPLFELPGLQSYQ